MGLSTLDISSGSPTLRIVARLLVPESDALTVLATMAMLSSAIAPVLSVLSVAMLVRCVHNVISAFALGVRVC